MALYLLDHGHFNYIASDIHRREQIEFLKEIKIKYDKKEIDKKHDFCSLEESKKINKTNNTSLFNLGKFRVIKENSYDLKEDCEKMKKT